MGSGRGRYKTFIFKNQNKSSATAEKFDEYVRQMNIYVMFMSLSMTINHPHPEVEALRLGFARPQHLANVNRQTRDKRTCFGTAIVPGLFAGRNKNRRRRDANKEIARMEKPNLPHSGDVIALPKKENQQQSRRRAHIFAKLGGAYQFD